MSSGTNGLNLSRDFWIDDRGLAHRVLRTKNPRGRWPSVVALQRFVFIRDEFTCQLCAARPRRLPKLYDGKKSVFVVSPRGQTYLVVDHVVSMRNGGRSHPDNCQALCARCNCAKAGRVDAKHPAAIERRRREEQARRASLRTQWRRDAARLRAAGGVA
jgi:5-methylcytosine-specific restriction endonuclease McrA